MTQFISIFTMILLANVSYGAGSQDFQLDYSVHEGKAVCWQTCRFDWCEEAEYEIFWDNQSYRMIEEARDKGQLVIIEKEKYCGYDEQISVVNEHMPALQKEDPTKAAEIIEQSGTPVKFVIHSNIRKSVNEFVQGLLE